MHVQTPRPARHPGARPGVKPQTQPDTYLTPDVRHANGSSCLEGNPPRISCHVLLSRTLLHALNKKILRGFLQKFPGRIRIGYRCGLCVVLWMTFVIVSTMISGCEADNHSSMWTPASNYTGDFRSYCSASAFEASCGGTDVIVMTHALYGRMEIGECVSPGENFGCQTDVRHVLDSWCSGENACSISVPHAELDGVKTNCEPQYTKYLSASYICVNVQRSGCNQCTHGGIAPVSVTQGYLASVVSLTSQEQCGLTECPWQLEVASGQKITVTLLDFTNASTEPRSHAQRSCTHARVAVIQDPASHQREKFVCIGGERISLQYTSLSNSLKINFIRPILEEKEAQVLLYFEAVGCPDKKIQPDMWQNRQGDNVTIGCNSGNQKWELSCHGTEWRGEFGVCQEIPQEPSTTLPLGVLVAIVVGIALVIGVLILTIGIVCLKRHQHGLRHSARPEATHYIPASQEPEYREEISLQPAYYDSHKVRSQRAAAHRKHHLAQGGRENLYAGMNARPLPSIPNIHEQSQLAEDSDGSEKIQMYRTNSGKEHCQYHHRVLVRTTSSGSSKANPAPQSQASQLPSQVPATPTGSASGSGSGSVGQGSVGQGSRSGSKSGSAVVGTGSVAAAAAAGGSSSGASITPPVAGAAAAGPHCHTGPASGTPTPATCKDDHQYFILDPEQEARRVARLAAANGQPDESLCQGPGQGIIVARGPQKSPEEENAENVNKETLVGQDTRTRVVPERQTLPQEQNANSDTSEDLEVWVLMLRSQNYYIV